MHTIQLVTLPIKQEKSAKGRSQQKYLTGKKTMKSIKETHSKQEEKQKKKKDIKKLKKRWLKMLSKINYKVINPLGVYQVGHTNLPVLDFRDYLEVDKHYIAIIETLYGNQISKVEK